GGPASLEIRAAVRYDDAMVVAEGPQGSTPAVTFWGAAQTVSGSMHLVEAAGQTLLLDCGLVQGRRDEAERRNSAFPFHPGRATGLFRPVPYDTPFEAAPGVRATFVDAGHLPGSEMVTVEIKESRRRYTLTFTGDLGRPALGVLPPPAAVPPADVVLAECTYG